MKRFLITGLGNIGVEYAHTRHNAGFDVVTAFVLKHGGAFTVGRLAEIAEVKVKGKTFICIKPTTYMNESGKAFKYWMTKETIDLENTLTIVDDLSISLNRIRIRPGGSDGGHNGLRSIHAAIETTDYPKLRFGIGNNYPRGMQSEYVLGKWNLEERPIVLRKIHSCVEIIEAFGNFGIERTMNLFNTKTYT